MPGIPNQPKFNKIEQKTTIDRKVEFIDNVFEHYDFSLVAVNKIDMLQDVKYENLKLFLTRLVTYDKFINLHKSVKAKEYKDSLKQRRDWRYDLIDRFRPTITVLNADEYIEVLNYIFENYSIVKN
jgi:hypothetical protein